ncbi:MAG: tetratricopeptide (TPR) repeat protein, partial [Alcanivorax sp.]
MTSTSDDLQPADIQKRIASGNFAAALQGIDKLLSIDPGHTEALYMAAVCYRYTQKYDKAQTCLDSLMSLSYDRGRVYQEQGHLHVALNRPQKALAAFANACQLNPVLLASWQSQYKILGAIGRPQDAQQALAQ